MIALITGASSGIGKEIAKNLADRGCDLILVARRKERLIELKSDIISMCNVRVKIICADLSDENQCYRLFNSVKDIRVDFLINNAGFGLYGKFDKTPLESELKMIDVNIKAVHILTKLFLQDFKERDFGYILNVASIAGFMPGPMFSTYYATKNYVLQLTKAIYEELSADGSHVHISALCPGPVDTEFNKTAGLDSFGIPSHTDIYVANYAIERMLMGELVIIPGISTKVGALASKVAPTKLLLKVVRNVQINKNKDN